MRMSVGAALALGAVIGLALGIVVSVTTDVPFAPEAGLVLGALVGGSRAGRANRRRAVRPRAAPSRRPGGMHRQAVRDLWPGVGRSRVIATRAGALGAARSQTPT